MPASAARHKPHDLIRYLWLGTLLVDFFVVGMAVSEIVGGRQHAVEQATVLTENYAKILEENLVGFISKIDNTLKSTAEEIARETKAGGVRRQELETFLAQQDAHLPEALGVRVVDADGVIRYAVNDLKVRNVSIADRPQFIRLKQDAQAGLVISKPVFGRAALKQMITLGRRLDAADGSFAGDVHVAVAVERFIDIFSHVDLGSSGNIGLWDSDTLIARFSREDRLGATTGSTTPSAQLREFLRTQPRQAIYRARSGVDGVARIYHFRRVGEYPLYLLVGLADEDVLAEWRQDTLRAVSLTALFLLATSVFAWLVFKGWRQQERAESALQESRARLDLSLRGADLALADWDVASDTVVFGRGWEKLLGYSLDELPQHSSTIVGLILPEDLPAARGALIRHLKGEQPSLQVELRMRHKDGRAIWVLARGMAVERDSSGRATRLAGTGMDISARKLAEEQIARLSQWNELLLNSAGDGIYGVDREGRCIFINPTALNMLGFNKSELLGGNQHSLFHHHHQDGSAYPDEDCPIFQTLHDGVRREIEDAFVRKSGEVFPVRITTAPIVEGGRIVGAEVVFQDISRRKAMEAELLRLATTDSLTGMANRRHFLEQLENELARLNRFGKVATLLMIDIDYFKDINDTHGHATGDAVLQHFAELARQRLRRIDMLGRLGGEEFGILLPGTDAAGAGQFSRQFRQDIAENPARTGKGPIAFTVSIGVAEFSSTDVDADSILARSDVALYRAKSLGRDRVEIG
jgi:diguanylate cyclase (GGDEF)-like protein/PAS domain S-box-containing protein